MLDYGAGRGLFAALLRESGYGGAVGYDPFFGDDAPPDGRFDVVSCFEVMEHMVDPGQGAADLARYLAPEGLLVFSTLVQPADIEAQGISWWYAAPRNGHVSLHTRESLRLLLGRQGLTVYSHSDALHFAYAQIPAFARHFLPTG